jgi:hypothetical protein
VALSYILESILNEKIKTMQESWPFMKPVNRKQLKVYYEMIKEPMDLETIEKKVAKHSYHSRWVIHFMYCCVKEQFWGLRRNLRQMCYALILP